ncbi:unnamed protein product [Staurois parvus]|uniref:Uncharacterized protein n=1 Tax=Staurois parvus TaxID=386267 RepID=A0ABN9FUB8_9NEOB|nr:unnamed protein product [Staurois parvus]
MHSPKKKKPLVIHTELSMCSMVTVHSVLSEDKIGGRLKKGRNTEDRIKQSFYTM